MYTLLIADAIKIYTLSNLIEELFLTGCEVVDPDLFIPVNVLPNSCSQRW
jgi:hypothetical protein